MLKRDLQRGFNSWAFWLGMLTFGCGLVAMAIPYQHVVDGSSPVFVYGMLFTNVLLLLPALLCVLPLGTAFFDEWNSQYYRLAISRLGWVRYGYNRVASTAIIGGLSVMLPATVALFACYTFVPENGATNTLFANMDYPMYRSWMPGGPAQAAAMPGGQVLLLERWFAVVWMLRLFLFGACWSQLGLAVSAWVDDWALTLVIPFATYIAVNGITSRYGPGFLDCKSMIGLGGLVNYPMWVSLAVPLGWGLLFIALFIWGIRRRIAHE